MPTIQELIDIPASHAGAVRFIKPLSPDVFYAAMQALDIDAMGALRDPVRAMRVASTADELALRRFLFIVLRGGVPKPSDEEVLRLYAAGVLAELLRKMRGMRHSVPREYGRKSESN